MPHHPPPAPRPRGKLALATLGLLIALAQPAAADSLQDWLVDQFKAQGYQNIAVSRTFLGRLRVVGHLGDMHREVVVNPRTGEVLRDVSMPDTQAHSGDTARPALPPPPGRDARGDDAQRPARADDSPAKDRPETQDRSDKGEGDRDESDRDESDRGESESRPDDDRSDDRGGDDHGGDGGGGERGGGGHGGGG